MNAELNELISSSHMNVNKSVFSSERIIIPPKVSLPENIKMNCQQKMDGMKLLGYMPDHCVVAAFFDPQYRGILDKMEYGNEGESRGHARCSLKQMTEKDIHNFIKEIDRVLIDSGHLFLWMDKFHLCTGFLEWLSGTRLEVVDMITWNKGRIGMGYRTRRTCEYLVILQRLPKKAKGVWKLHNIRDVWDEVIPNGNGVHPKPIELQSELIEAVSNAGDLILDPAAGSYSVLKACQKKGRHFIGCDLIG
jgi:site-specific DNA-methyltransferase (adenine-specific)